MFGSLQDGEFSAELLDITCTDAALGRMSAPRIINATDPVLADVNIAHLFGVEQGVHSDGARKVRAVDDETRAGVNPCCAASERLRVDNIDMLFNLVSAFFVAVGIAPSLWKSDIDAAFRRIPLRPSERWAAYVAFIAYGKTYLAGHFALPFGAIA